MKNSEIRLAILISGGGTTAEAILSAVSTGELTGIIPAVVISSRINAAGIAKAMRFGMKVVVTDPAGKTSDEFASILLETCRNERVDFVSQNGWLPHTPAVFISEFQGRIVNQHPGPLDPGRVDFGGKGMFGARVTCARLAYCWITDSDYWTESTVHHVAEEIDMGAILQTAYLPIPRAPQKVTLADMQHDPSTLTETVKHVQDALLPLEHQNVISYLRAYVNNSVSPVSREKVLIPPGFEGIVADVKKLAAQLYPGG